MLDLSMQLVDCETSIIPVSNTPKNLNTLYLTKIQIISSITLPNTQRRILPLNILENLATPIKEPEK
jgi:hypothetical protein